MLDAIKNLIKVKTIVTLIFTGVFAFLCCTGKVDSREFITVFTVVISFYFGTQHEKIEQSVTTPTTGSEKTNE